MALSFRYAARSDVGLVRSDNQDSGYAGPSLLVVADGMGGHAAGDLASAAAVAELATLDANPPREDVAGPELLGVLRERLEAANARLREIVEAHPELEGMGTTVTMLVRADGRLGLAHVGDSRCYLLHDGVLTRITRDDTYVQTLVDAGQITPEEAGQHPQRSVLTQALDGRNLFVPHLSVRPARAGDRYLLCSDGLSAVLSDDTIAENLAGDDLEEAADRLVELALRAGGPDNVTCIVAEVVDEGVGHDGRGGPAGAGAGAGVDVGAGAGVGAGAEPTQLTPIVVGAAASSTARRLETGSSETMPGGPASSAQRAAALRQAVPATAMATATTTAAAPSDEAGDESALVTSVAGPAGRRRRRGVRAPVVVLATLAVLAGLGWWGWSWSQDQYYVGAVDGQVAIYRGLSQSLGPARLSTVYEVAEDVSLGDLPAFSRQRVEEGIVADNLADARRIVAELRDIVAACEARAGLPGCGGAP